MAFTLDNWSDIGNRKILRKSLSSFKGRPAQNLNIRDDKNRPVVFYGDYDGHYEESILKSDFNEGNLDLFINKLSKNIKTVTVDSANFNLDATQSNVFEILLHGECKINLTNLTTKSNEIQDIIFIVTNIDENSNLSFLNPIHWIGTTPQFPSKLGVTYIIRLYKTSTSILGEYVTSAYAHNYTDGSSHSKSISEWILPAGDPNGGNTNKISQYFFMDVSDEDKQAITDITQNISDVHKIADALQTISHIETNLGDIRNISENTTALSSLASSINKLNQLSESLETLLDIQKYISNINIIAHHIKDKNFLDVKVTSSSITANTILQLDKIILAPAAYVSESHTGSSIQLDTDSSDGTISPSLIVYSDVDVNDNVMGDGTLVVTPTVDKINPVIKR